MSSPFRFDNGSPIGLIYVKSSQKGKNVSKVGIKTKANLGALKCEIRPLTEITEGRVSITLPIRTISEGNCFEPWQKKHKRHKSQKLQIRLALLPHKCKIKLPCAIKLTRYAPRSLDKHDNLPMSFKFITDALCEELTNEYIAGKADSDERISITYDQVKSKEYYIKIEITF